MRDADKLQMWYLIATLIFMWCKYIAVMAYAYSKIWASDRRYKERANTLCDQLCREQYGMSYNEYKSLPKDKQEELDRGINHERLGSSSTDSSC